MQSQYNTNNPLKIGTRGSPLALKQAENVRNLLCEHYGWAEDATQICIMKTTGDRFTDRPLSAIGGKGLFTKELEEGLYDRTIDIAVHSMKDVATILPDGMKISTVLRREDPRDAFVSYQYRSIYDLPKGAVVGTSSLRRKAQLLNKRPDLEVVEFRGIVGTRLQKLEDGIAQATFLAMAGLKRLGQDALFDQCVFAVEMDDMLPAAAQAAVGIEIRAEDEDLEALLLPLNDASTHHAIMAERAFLRVLDGSCRTPIAAHFDGQKLKGEVLSLDGSNTLFGEWTGDDPIALGEMGAQELLQKGAADVLGR